MKMESSSACTIEAKNKSKEDLLLLSENNNTDTANGESKTNDGNATITGSVAMTTSTKSQLRPEDDSTPETVNLDVVKSANSPSTDDSKNQVINHVDISAHEESEVIQEVVVQEEDSQTDSTALQEQEGASSNDNVIQAEDSNVENKIDDENVANPSSDLIGTEEDVPEDTIEKSHQSVDADGKSNEENTKQERDVHQNEENIMEVEDQTEMVNADVEVKNDDAAKDEDSWSKMHLTEDVSDGNQIQAASPGHTEQRPNTIATSSTAPTILQRNGIVKVTNEENTDKSKIVTNGNDHTEDDDDTTNSIKTEQVCQNKSPEYTATTTQAVDLDSIVPPKRRMSTSSPQDQVAGAQSSNSKRMKITTLENHDFKTRDQILNNYMENMDCTGFEGLKNNTDQLLSEIQKLGELAKMKEREWNQILHQKKLREELLLRLQRAKQILVLQTNGNTNSKHQDQLLQRYQTQQPNQQQHRQVYQQQQDVSVTDKGRQGPLLDVQKMISDYRQTHPESIPRRGRRIRGQDGQQGLKYDSGNLLTFSNVALGSGSQVRTTNSSSSSLANINQDIYNEFSLLLSSMDNDRLKTASSSSIKELLAQFARMSASERQDLLNSVKGPHNINSSQSTSYPEVTVHPVQQSAAPVAPSTSNSLLHGILTKPVKSTAPSNESKQPTFSPTLARLLTAPERSTATTSSSSSSSPSTSTSSATATSAAISVPSTAASVVSASSLIHSTISSNHQHHRHKNTTSSAQQNNNHQSLSDLILSSTKARNEITITPVQQYEDQSKSILHHQDDEADDGTDRLVIDEGDSHAGRNKQVEEEAAEEVPQCQGCNHKAAQFVCAGCGNQWYCSRECQVSAWDEHSEVCSG